MADDVAVPVSEVLGAMTTEPLAEGDEPMGAFMMIKSIDSAGDPVWAVREAGQGVTPEEMLGALTAYTEYLRRRAYTEYLRRSLAEDWAD